MISEEHHSQEPLWVEPKCNPKWKQTIVKEFRLHPVIAQILVSRGFRTFDEIHHFLYAKLPDLHDPFLFKDIRKGVNRIIEARKKGEMILIYGDNDVDGMTGTALLAEFLEYIGCKVIFYVASPSAQKKTTLVEALDTALENQVKVLITVDVGITAAKEIAEFTKAGIDVIVTDHHEPTDELPKCTCILNPKLQDNTYPDRSLTGVGVAFKFAHAVTNELVTHREISPNKVDLKRYLDLVALGTISDMGALQGENRIFVRYGLNLMRKRKRVGLAKLLEISEVNPSQLNSFVVASRISPPLNSLGRIANANDGVKLLMQRSPQQAQKLAEELGMNNIERQRIERGITQDVETLLKENPSILNEKAIVLASDRWHPGIIPIIATRLSKTYNRPTVIISINENFGKGSLRSITEFPLLDALKECSSLLENFGGHDYAAGLFIREENIPAFKERFIKIANKKLKDQDVKNKVLIDAEVDFDNLTYDCLESMKLLEPYGNENPPPILSTIATQAWPPKVIGRIADRAHLKLYLEQDDRVLEGVALGRASDSAQLRHKGLKLKVAYTPQMDPNQFYLQLLVKDFKIIPSDKKK